MFIHKFRDVFAIKIVDRTNMYELLLSSIVYSAPSCASQPISLHRNLNFLANLITYFVNMCNIYK